MYLKRLTMKGFKSFADTTALDFEPGVTVVVGPNGSGKSNVVDAIGWVLGAQAPSAVRSQKMDDVIFAGTTKRAALGRAEVSLTIDNASGILPIEFSEVTITRTLFRSGDSEYALNGVPCRLLDIQELLSDSGVGRQQHVIISQGQIDAVLNARPEDRRAIIEEAAGVLKYRRRKEKSERRLSATEGNLTRLQDLLREVRRQLRPLERQADAARRHGAVVAELTSLRVYLAGRELHGLRTRLEQGSRSRIELQSTEERLRRSLAELDTQVMSTEAELTAMGGDDIGDGLAQYESLFQQARGLTAVLAERRRGIDRARGASIDQGVVASLEAEAARLAAELSEVEDEASRFTPLADELLAAEGVLADERQAFEAQWATGVPAPTGAAAEVRGELAALRAAAERGRSERDRVSSRVGALTEKTEQLAAEAERLRLDLVDAESAELPLVEQIDVAESRRADAESKVGTAETIHRAAESDHHAWQARVEALALALDEARSRAGTERLSGIDGVLGTVLDLVDVDPGWEDAFEAAAGEALAAVVVDGVDSGRRALEALHGEALSGAVLALGAARSTRAAPSVGEPLRRHVRARRPDVEPLLDALIDSAVVVTGGWVAAVDASLAHPDAIIVTSSGDRFGVTGWRVGVSGSGATGAALEEAEVRSGAAFEAATVAAGALEAARAELGEALVAEAELARQLDANDSQLTAAGDRLQRVETDRRDAATEAEALQSHLGELTDRVAREGARITELEQRLPELELADTELAESARRMSEARSRLEEQAADVGSRRSDLEVRSVAVTERREFLTGRLADAESRLEGAAAEREAAESRRLELDRTETALERMSALIAARSSIIESQLEEFRDRRRRQSEAAREVATRLDALRRRRAEEEKALSEQRERLARSEIEQAEIEIRIEAAVEALRRDLECEPDVAIATECPELADGVTPAARTRELERDLRLMGPINPLALEEFEALQERHEFLEKQLEDVKESRRELAKVIRAIDGEIVNVFAAAFADVAANFEALFQLLFPGGQGRLKLTDPDNLLITGIEVEARPSGKNVRKLSLLSGGERSLTALAYLFAVFRSRPSPFYVMDEVEAALDDVNLHRFLGLVAEFRNDAQLVIVSHQKRTMEAADCLYGVTMQSGGSSKVVSEKVNES